MGLMDSIFSAREMFSRLLGSWFQGSRDYWRTFGYLNYPPFSETYLKYTRQDIAGRIVDLPADALWDNPPVVTSDNQEWSTAWDNLVTNFNLWQVLSRADKLAGLDLYSIIVVGVAGTGALDTPLLDPTAPLPVRGPGRPRKAQGIDPGSIIYLQPYSADGAMIEEFDNDPSSPYYMLPKIYKLRGNNFTQQNVQNTNAIRFASRPDIRVHASRVLHVVEGALENQVFGVPRMHRVFNLLDDLIKVVGGSAETFWMVSDRGLQIDVDKEMALSPDDAADLTDELDEWEHGRRRVIRTRGVKINPIGSDTPSPQQNVAAIMSLISGASGIPQRILVGSEAGQLASEQDRANWAERTTERRQHFGEPTMIFQAIKKFTAMGVLPAPPDLTITIQWPDAFKLSPLERAQTSAQKARSAANLINVFTTAEPGTGQTINAATPFGGGGGAGGGADPNAPGKAGASKGGAAPGKSNDPGRAKAGKPATQAAPAPASASGPAGAPEGKIPSDASTLETPAGGGAQVIPAVLPGYDLLTIEEARSFMELGIPTPTFNETSDVTEGGSDVGPASQPTAQVGYLHILEKPESKIRIVSNVQQASGLR
jgi:hypothetical protein